jgi:hypothetical protein
LILNRLQVHVGHVQLACVDAATLGFCLGVEVLAAHQESPWALPLELALPDQGTSVTAVILESFMDVRVNADQYLMVTGRVYLDRLDNVGVVTR